MRLGQGTVSAALAALVCGVTAASAQSAGPAEFPSAGFVGRQYVDSAGCVFLREGEGSEARWVARVNRDGQPLCGYPPSPKSAEIVPPPVAPEPEAPAVPEPPLALPLAPPATPAAPPAVAAASAAPAPAAQAAENRPTAPAPDATPHKPVVKKAPVRKDPLAGKYVQVGAFAIAQNAERAKARLQRLGLPVSTQRVSGLTIVFAGPLAADQLTAALRAARGAGFDDAYIR